MTGQTPVRALISGVTNAERCEVTTSTDHGFTTGDFVRVTDLNGCIKTPPGPRGMDQINDKLFLVYVTGATTFLLRDYTTHQYIDSTNYTPYIQGGRVNLDHHDFNYQPEE